MHESSFIIMEVDAILRSHIGSDITSGSFFHVLISREIYEFPTHIECEIRMPVDLVWSRDKDIGGCDREEKEDEPDDMFFHIHKVLKTASNARITDLKNQRD
jgi:hypothetical protein